MEKPKAGYLLVIGGSTNDSTIGVCRELIFKYGRQIINADYLDARDYILYDLEEYYISNKIYSDGWFCTFGDQIDIINNRRGLYTFVGVENQELYGLIRDAKIVIDLSHFCEPSPGDIQTTAVKDLKKVVDTKWCHMTKILESVSKISNVPVLHLLSAPKRFKRGSSLLKTTFMPLHKENSFSNREIYFTMKQLFQEFENGNI